jgi:hypothetical protein
VIVTYAQPTSVPASNVTITCPSGAVGNCGAAGGAGWKSTLDIGKAGNGTPPGWYPFSAATYTPLANGAEVCNGHGISAAISDWPKGSLH